jgi:polar amino acid transport system substrate-binding protein
MELLLNSERQYGEMLPRRRQGCGVNKSSNSIAVGPFGGSARGGVMFSFRVRYAWLRSVLPVLLLVAVADGTVPSTAMAQACGTEYKIKEGETLAQIAARVYGNPAQWTVIFYANQERLGANASLLVPGLSIVLPCVGGTASQSAPQTPNVTAPAQQPAQSSPTDTPIMISAMVRRVEFLTADGYPPFTGRSLEGGGMLTEVVSSAMNIVKQEAKGRFDFGISWVNDWSAHLNPLLLTRAFDVGYPWARPDCDTQAGLDASSQFRCRRFFFSDPLYEVITSLFVRNNSAITSLQSEKINGVTFCLPAGQAVYELDQGGRNWVKDGKITLMRPPTVDECFRLLDNGTAEGVVVTEYSGRASVNSLGLTDKVRMLDQPVALTPLHVVISKSHPHARTILYYVNTALAKLRESGDYDMIIERHLDRFWEAQQTSAPSPAIGLTPATQSKNNRAPAQGGNTPAPELVPAATAPKPPATKTETKLAR